MLLPLLSHTYAPSIRGQSLSKVSLFRGCLGLKFRHDQTGPCAIAWQADSMLFEHYKPALLSAARIEHDVSERMRSCPSRGGSPAAGKSRASNANRLEQHLQYPCVCRTTSDHIKEGCSDSACYASPLCSGSFMGRARCIHAQSGRLKSSSLHGIRLLSLVLFLYCYNATCHAGGVQIHHSHICMAALAARLLLLRWNGHLPNVRPPVDEG